MSIETWVEIGRYLVSCLIKISEHSKEWTNGDPLRDFTSTAWTTLEQQGATSFIAAEVAIAQDLDSEDQMRGARTALQDVANDTADHLGLLIQVNEQIHIHNQAMEQWMNLHRDKPWFSLAKYRGLEWQNVDRDDDGRTTSTTSTRPSSRPSARRKAPLNGR